MREGVASNKRPPSRSGYLHTLKGRSMSAKTNIFRIIQELLTNAARHAEPTLITISLVLADDAMTITVEDNGKGITAAQIKHSDSLGIVSMEERALLIGGTFTITGQPGVGTVARLTVPVTPSQRHEKDLLKVRS